MAKARSARQPKRQAAEPTSPEFLAALAESLKSITDHLAKREGPCTILIVEDDADARDILASVLSHAGYSTVAVSNGREALETLEKVLPGLIIFDLRMPEMDGWALDRALKADPTLRKIPVVVVSAFAKLSASRTGVSADAWFQKPVDLEALLETLPTLVSR